MNADIGAIIAQIPGWSNVKDLKIEQLAGLTDTNYLVTANRKRFVLRVSGENTALLGVNHLFELEALEAASNIGIGPEVVHFILPQGHLVTRYIKGQPWKDEEYHTPENLRRVIETVKRIHNLPAIEGTFSPFRRVMAYADRVKGFHVPFPEDFDTMLERMRAIKARQQQDDDSWLKLCHNDLYLVNILDDRTVRIIDWEFAGMGDIHFDLATLVYACDTTSPLGSELEEYLLECYFGEINDVHRERLAGMKYMVLFFTAMWGMLQHGLRMEGAIPVVEGFDYLEYAEYKFGVMREAV